VAVSTDATQKKFSEALRVLIEQVKADRSVLAAILCGSLSHDTVWEKSDIDLVLVTIDIPKVDRQHVALYADGLNVHAFLMPRAEFRKTVEGSVHNSFLHSLLAKGRLLYTHDPTIATLCARLQDIGERDTQIQLLGAAAHALQCIYKARKWFLTRGDLEYTALWILYAATPLARIEMLSRILTRHARLVVDREVILQAMKLNPKFFQMIYTDLLNTKKTKKNVQAALEAAEAYLAKRAESLFRPVLDHLREAGETRSATDIDDHFKRNFGVEGLATACEYLADQSLLGKVSVPLQLTRRSNLQVQELAFVDLGEKPDEF
jgi:uncharacterized protein